MENSLLDRLSKYLSFVLLAGSVLYIVVYLAVVFFRIRYPFELMWQEGASVDHMIRMLSVLKYYDSPSIEFIASIYTPLYFYLSALLSKLIGIGFLPLRLLSFVSSLGCFLIIFLMVRRETGSGFSGIIATGLFAATYELSGSWFDVGRADSLFLFLLLWAIYLLRFNESMKPYFFAGVLVSLSYLTKQTAIVISLPIMLYCIYFRRRLAFFFIAPITVIAGLGSVLMNYLYEGWFYFYVFELPKTTPVDIKYLINFWPTDIIIPLPVAFSIVVFYLFSQLKSPNKNKMFFYLFAGAGMFVASWYSRYRGGGFYNVLFPAYAIVSITFGLGVNEILKRSSFFYIRNDKLKATVLYALCIVQFSMNSLLYDPFKQVPKQKDLEAGWHLIDKMSQVKGDIFSPYHGYFATLAGKKSYANMMGMRDVLTTSDEKHVQIKKRLVDDIKQAMREKKFGAVIIDSFEPWYPFDMRDHYVEKEKIFDDENVFYPVTGMRTRPEFIYAPKEN
ncbi:hypothetical protein C4544_04820 [candidate division WS5 bacterium]|uniref:Glycosyltransferase RgtA/B/C/D-like domain-containing protein n=1 Tax=candidate division WS5 bacterium TaxID=2093353 RepID=A0A419DBV2_9BACT|nr:MAG: hypothetical protein C4544_04820 [candidate division WS5 bacterium]